MDLKGCMWIAFVIGILVPEIIHAQCPRDRVVNGVTCRECPEGSRCIARRCCWDEQSPVSAPCDDPMMRGSTFVTCDPGRGGGRGAGQGGRRVRSCPGHCHTCRDLSGVGMGLCCPEIRWRGCESSSPAQVEFERAAQRIRSSGMTSSGGRGDSLGRGGASQTDFGASTSRDLGLSQSRSRDLDLSRSRSRDSSRRTSPTSRPRIMMLRPDPIRPSSPCGVGVRPLGTCNYRVPMMPPCPRGLYCVPAGFMEVCCPIGTGPAAGSRSDSRRFSGFDPMAGSRFSRRGDPVSSRRGSMTFDGSRQRGRTGDSFTGRSSGSSPFGSGGRRGVESDLFGPLPSYDFPMGPNDPRTQRRGRCPMRVQCIRTGDDECYADNHCAAPFRCCSAGRGCANRCLVDEASLR